MSDVVRTSPIYRSLNKPLTILGVERKLFFLAMLVGAGVFNFFGSLLGALLMFAALFLLARWATATDPQLLRIVLNASKLKVRYDPAKWAASRDQRVRLDD